MAELIDELEVRERLVCAVALAEKSDHCSCGTCEFLRTLLRGDRDQGRVLALHDEIAQALIEYEAGNAVERGKKASRR